MCSSEKDLSHSQNNISTHAISKDQYKPNNQTNSGLNAKVKLVYIIKQSTEEENLVMICKKMLSD
jgi:hypothetical protein